MSSATKRAKAEVEIVKCGECNGTDPDCELCDGKGEQEMVACRACSIAGGEDRSVYHSPPECDE